MARSKESLVYIRIHVDHQVLLDCDLLARFNGVFNPFSEILTSYRVGDIHDPLFWKLESFFLIWKVLDNFRILGEKLADIL